MNTHAALCAVMRGVQLPLSMALVESARHHDVHLLIAQQRASQEDGVSGAVLRGLNLGDDCIAHINVVGRRGT